MGKFDASAESLMFESAKVFMADGRTRFDC
jgi:hypothetical protein